MVRISAVLVVVFLFSSCAINKHALDKQLKATETKFQDHTGFVLYDLDKKQTIYSYRADRYFTPASNTKIFTLFASLKILGDSVPALKYEESQDSLIFWGTGDPSFLYKNVFTTSATLDFLTAAQKPVYFSASNFYTTCFGPGWAWDDYNDDYSAERSAFPVYGNILSAEPKGEDIRVSPRSFEGNFLREDPGKKGIVRDPHDNTFRVASRMKSQAVDIPFRTSAALTVQLLRDTLKRPVGLSSKRLPSTAKTIFSIAADSLYKVMMQESDNFIAEQLLLLCSSVLTDSLKPEIAINHVKKNFLNDLSDKPVWVDGSGLSRYNLFTPRSIVQLWEKIYGLVPRERLFSLLAAGGKNGTVKNWYKAEQPYIFGKTGSLSNNHCLSGYLITKKGRTLIFSWMNNNFTTSSAAVRKDMQDILKMIYEKY